MCFGTRQEQYNTEKIQVRMKASCRLVLIRLFMVLGVYLRVLEDRTSLQLASAPVPLTKQQRDCRNGIEFMIKNQLQERCQRFLLLSLLFAEPNTKSDEVAQV
jgi:hypothetical protein